MVKRLRVPPARHRLSRGAGPFQLIRQFFANFAVLAPEEQQRFAGPHHGVFYLCNKYRVVASFMRPLQPAFQIG